jgi:hypothetical protein
MACTTPDDVQVICPVHQETPRRLKTGGGWRRTCVWRERRWPNFIIWRWAGPDQDGWIPCPRKAPRLLLPRPRRHPLPSMSPLRLDVPRGPAAPAARPVRSLPAGQRNGGAKSRPAVVLRRLPAEPKRPSGADAGRPARAPVNPPVQAAGNQPVARAPVLPRGSGPRRVAAGGGANPTAPGPRRS